jgi:TetR/AcrR family transcriptional regulator, regulator of cefoperazone and chloramphenicol sensitivity
MQSQDTPRRQTESYDLTEGMVGRGPRRPRGAQRLKRYSASGGYACGEQTRARIISAALLAFGEQGYDRASTRQIAALARVNTPAIQYYFGGKRGLHSACARYVIGRVSSVLALPLAGARDALRTAAPAAALGALCELLAAVVDGLVVAGPVNWNRYLTCASRDEGEPGQTLFHEHLSAGLFDTITGLIAAATGCSSGAKVTRLRACVLLGYVNSLYVNRTHVLAVMGWSHFDEHALALIKSIVREHTRGALAAARASPIQGKRGHRGSS